MNENKQIEIKKIPKTYTTRKGQLLLFSEEQLSTSRHEAKEALFSSSIRSFRREVLDFGTTSLPPPQLQPQSQPSSAFLERDHTLSSLSNFLKERNTQMAYYCDRVRPGYSAKRYLASWIRKWKPDLIDK